MFKSFIGKLLGKKINCVSQPCVKITVHLICQSFLSVKKLQVCQTTECVKISNSKLMGHSNFLCFWPTSLHNMDQCTSSVDTHLNSHKGTKSMNSRSSTQRCLKLKKQSETPVTAAPLMISSPKHQLLLRSGQSEWTPINLLSESRAFRMSSLPYLVCWLGRGFLFSFRVGKI